MPKAHTQRSTSVCMHHCLTTANLPIHPTQYIPPTTNLTSSNHEARIRQYIRKYPTAAHMRTPTPPRDPIGWPRNRNRTYMQCKGNQSQTTRKETENLIFLHTVSHEFSAGHDNSMCVGCYMVLTAGFLYHLVGYEYLSYCLGCLNYRGSEAFGWWLKGSRLRTRVSDKSCQSCLGLEGLKVF
ncbi:hypothetical protein BJX68DRAFT_36824 [Aspergillus pseudodeflectus]|uniref:LITAF domain-containing protein n=1 Tax=Aspergillus pseudodeflectus TaxID=176178 RepID=A0ABR4J9G1_9EURO